MLRTASASFTSRSAATLRRAGHRAGAVELPRQRFSPTVVFAKADIDEAHRWAKSGPQLGHMAWKRKSPQDGGLRKCLIELDILWLRGQDLNLRPLGYEPNELPDCSTSRLVRHYAMPCRRVTYKPAESRVWEKRMRFW